MQLYVPLLIYTLKYRVRETMEPTFTVVCVCSPAPRNLRAWYQSQRGATAGTGYSNLEPLSAVRGVVAFSHRACFWHWG